MLEQVLQVEGLTNLHSLNLTGNDISDISPLLENSGISEGDFLYFKDNLLSTTSVDVYIPQLKARGVTIIY